MEEIRSVQTVQPAEISIAESVGVLEEFLRRHPLAMIAAGILIDYLLFIRRQQQKGR